MKALMFLILAAAGIVGWVLIAASPSASGQFWTSDSQERALWLTLGYALLVVGMVLGVLVRALMHMRDAGQEEVDVGGFFKRSWRRIDLWVSLLASPILYGSIVVTSKLEKGAFCYFALQTGFSSYVTIRSLLEGGKPRQN